MNRIRLLSVVALACLGLPTLQPLSGQDAKVLLVVKEGISADLDYVLTQEVGVMRSMLKEAGFQVVVASPSAQPLVGEATTLTPDLRLADVDMGDYAGMILPCMANETEAKTPELEALLQQAVASGKPVAAQLGSVVHLARAGVLEGKKYAFVEEFLPSAPELEGLDFGGQGVVEDGNILTGGVCPYAAQMVGLEDTTSALTRAFLAHLTAEGG